MKWLLSACLALVAIVLALLVLQRLRRGQPVVLTGRWSPRVIRMVAVVLVMLGVGESARAQEAKGAPNKLPTPENNDKLPNAITIDAITAWLTHQTSGSQAAATKLVHAKLMATHPPTAELLDAVRTHVRLLPAGLAKLLLADLQALKDGKPLPTPTVAQLKQALTDCSVNSYYDHYWTAYLWRKATDLNSADSQAWTDVFAGLRQQARITDTLIRVHATVKPIMLSQRAWMSKAGPGPAERQLLVEYRKAVADMLKLAGEQFPTVDEGTWKRDGIVLLKADPDALAPVLIRAGHKKDFSTEFTTRLGRLDLLKTNDKPAVLLHDSLGKIEIPAQTLLSVGQLHQYLPDATKRKLEQMVHDALTKNSEDAADRLETMLPFAHAAIRAGLKEQPTAKGAPRLRMILALFDDAPMPVVKPIVSDRNDFDSGGVGSPGRPPGVGGGGRGPGDR